MPDPLLLTREQCRRVDRWAIERCGIPGVVLMENAGRGAVETLLKIDPTLGHCVADSQPPEVAVICGKGSNAGDGFVIARHLAVRGVRATTFLVLPPRELVGDARVNYDALVQCGLSVVDLSAEASAGGVVDATRWHELLDQRAGGASWLIDALLGTGAQGAPREPLATVIQWMNRQSARRLAVDVPSGLDCDAGKPPDVAVRADATCTFVAAKVGFAAPEARPFVGELHMASIGLPRSVVEAAIRG